MQSREGQAHLRFDTSSSDEPAAVSAPDEQLQQRGLPDACFSTNHHSSTAARPSIRP
jgi:hypothetical protein